MFDDPHDDDRPSGRACLARRLGLRFALESATKEALAAMIQRCEVAFASCASWCGASRPMRRTPRSERRSAQRVSARQCLSSPRRGPPWRSRGRRERVERWTAPIEQSVAAAGRRSMGSPRNSRAGHRRKGSRRNGDDRPRLWPEVTRFLDAVVLLDAPGGDFWSGYDTRSAPSTSFFSRDGGKSDCGEGWPTKVWTRHFGIGAHIVRSLWHQMMFDSEDDGQYIALALCGQGHGRTAMDYIVRGNRRRAGHRGRAKIRASREAA